MMSAQFLKENASAVNIVIAVAASLTVLAMGAVYSKRKRKIDVVPEKKNKRSAEIIADETIQYPGGKLSIYFGSQTGTAEGFAKDFAEEGKKCGFNAEVIDLEDFEAEQVLEANLAVFIMATYGEGEPTDNAAEFLNWLKGETSPGHLEKMNYSVFGLGNRQYEHFNQTSKTVDKMLEKKGGKRFFKLGLGDDDSSLEEDWEAWREEIWPVLLEKFNKSQNSSLSRDASAREIKQVEPPFELVYKRGNHAPKRLMEAEMNASTRYFFHSHELRVVINRELRNNDPDGSTLHIELAIPQNSKVSYQTADNLAILPRNGPKMVETLASKQGWDLSKTFDLKYQKGQKALFPTPCTVQQALFNYVDINAPPRKSALAHLAAYARDPHHADALSRLASKEGADEFKDFIEAAGRSLFEVMCVDFPSVYIPLPDFLTLAPALQPRYYTISSSSTVHPNRIHITASVVGQKRKDGRVFKGVCTHYLKNLVPPETENGRIKGPKEVKGPRDWPTLQAFVRPSTFRLPSNPATPIILIGPGTGIAPMRALLQERTFQAEEGKQVGPNLLYFGCKHENSDYIYRDELENYLKTGSLAKLRLAFSRDGKKKVYVQHHLSEDANEIWSLINDQNAFVYVCGGTSMGRDVVKALEEVAKSKGRMKAEKAQEYVKQMQVSGRYVQELWS